MTGLFDRLTGRARGQDTGAVRPLVTHPMFDEDPAPLVAIDEVEDEPARDELDARAAPAPAATRRAAPQVARFAGDRSLAPPVLDRVGRDAVADHRRTREDVDRAIAPAATPGTPADRGATAEHGATDSATSSLPSRLADPAGATALLAPRRGDRSRSVRHAPRTSTQAAATPAAAASDPPLVPEELVRPPALAIRAPAAPIAGAPAARPVVKVTIGRVEIRAVSPPSAAPRRSSPRRDAPSLSDYLARRDRPDPRGER